MLKGNSCNLWNITSTKLYTPNAGAVGMLLHINGNNEIISVLQSFVLSRSSLSISRCRSRNAADLAVPCVILYFKYNGIHAINIVTKHCIIQWKDIIYITSNWSTGLASFRLCREKLCMNFASYEYKNKFSEK